MHYDIKMPIILPLGIMGSTDSFRWYAGTLVHLLDLRKKVVGVVHKKV